MNHHYIEEQGIAALYSLGWLPAEERQQFEEHFMDCAAYLNQLDLIKNSWQIMQKAAARRAAPASLRLASLSGGLFERLSWFVLKSRVPVFAGLILLLVLSALLCLEIMRLRQQLHQQQLAAAQPPVAAPAPQAGENNSQTASSATAQPGPQPALPTPSRIRRAGETSRSLQPLVNIRTFSISSLRGEPVNRIEAPATTQLFIFSLELDGAPGYQDYRATLLTAAGQFVWSGSLQPSTDGSLSVGFPSAILPSGDYSLELAGLAPDGQFVAVANYPLRVLKK
jgi:hypothetical protein